MQKETWLGVLCSKDVKETTNILIEKIQNTIDNRINKVKIRHKQIKRNPWITESMMKSVDKKINLSILK